MIGNKIVKFKFPIINLPDYYNFGWEGTCNVN